MPNEDKEAKGTASILPLPQVSQVTRTVGYIKNS